MKTKFFASANFPQNRTELYYFTLDTNKKSRGTPTRLERFDAGVNSMQRDLSKTTEGTLKSRQPATYSDVCFNNECCKCDLIFEQLEKIEDSQLNSDRKSVTEEKSKIKNKKKVSDGITADIQTASFQITKEPKSILKSTKQQVTFDVPAEKTNTKNKNKYKVYKKKRITAAGDNIDDDKIDKSTGNIFKNIGSKEKKNIDKKYQEDKPIVCKCKSKSKKPQTAVDKKPKKYQYICLEGPCNDILKCSKKENCWCNKKDKYATGDGKYKTEICENDFKCTNGVCNKLLEKDPNFVCKCKERRKIAIPRDCSNDTCKGIPLDETSNPAFHRLQKKLLRMFQLPNQKICDRGWCEKASKVKKTFKCKCVQSECNDVSCVTSNKYIEILKQTHSFLKAKLKPCASKVKTQGTKYYPHLKKAGYMTADYLKTNTFETKKDQSGEPVIEMKINTVDMAVRDSYKVKNKIISLGTDERKTCICPSHSQIIKAHKAEDKNLSCPIGKCNTLKDKMTNFTCDCLRNRIYQCTKSNCNVNEAANPIIRYKTLTARPTPVTPSIKPLFDLRLNARDMSVFNADELNKSLVDIRRHKKKNNNVCDTGICRESLNDKKNKVICSCLRTPESSCTVNSCQEVIVTKSLLMKLCKKCQLFGGRILNEITSKSRFGGQTLSDDRRRCRAMRTFNTDSVTKWCHGLICAPSEKINENSGLKLQIDKKNIGVCDCQEYKKKKYVENKNQPKHDTCDCCKCVQERKSFVYKCGSFIYTSFSNLRRRRVYRINEPTGEKKISKKLTKAYGEIEPNQKKAKSKKLNVIDEEEPEKKKNKKAKKKTIDEMKPKTKPKEKKKKKMKKQTDPTVKVNKKIKKEEKDMMAKMKKAKAKERLELQEHRLSKDIQDRKETQKRKLEEENYSSNIRKQKERDTKLRKQMFAVEKKKQEQLNQKRRKIQEKEALIQEKQIEKRDKKINKEAQKQKKIAVKKARQKEKQELKELQKLIEHKEKHMEETSCMAETVFGIFKLAFNIIKFTIYILFKCSTAPKASWIYVKLRAKDPSGTYVLLKRWYLSMWHVKKLKMQRVIAGSYTISVLSDTFQDTLFYRAIARRGNTEQEKREWENRARRRKIRISRRRNEALNSCEHTLLTTLRRHPCLWCYHICPSRYPQCLSLVTFMRNFANMFMFTLAVCFWSPCILLYELCRAFLCCCLCTA